MGLIQNKVTVSQPNSHVVVKNAGGLRGLTGETGQQGPQGVPGEAATVTAGTTTTLPAGSDATVQNVGSTSAAIFNFGIPKGDKGDTGESGAAATISVGSTSTLPAGSSATVTNSGTSSAAVFDFGIPKGDKGDTGATGADGYSPSATVTKTGDTATITITDKDGTTTASISDGSTPIVNDGTLTIQKNGTTVQTFSADQASNVTANITVPTQFSDLSGTVSSSQIEDEAITTGSVSGTGTNITLAGTMEGGAIESVELNGDTQQTTYSGKNKAKYNATYSANGINSVLNSDGSLTCSGTTTTTYFNTLPYQATLPSMLPAGTYTFSRGGDTTYAVQIQLWDSTKNQTLTFRIPAGQTSITDTTTFDAYYYGSSFVYLSANMQINTTVKLQLESGSSPTSFEPYVGGTASPNPDYPQEVQTVTGEQSVNIRSKNILDKTTLEQGTFNYLNGTDSADSNRLRTQKIACIPNTIYTASANRSLSECAVVYYAQDGTTIIPGDGAATGNSYYTFTTPAGAYYMRARFGSQWNAMTLGNEYNLQIEMGSSGTTYEQYYGDVTKTVNLGKNLFDTEQAVTKFENSAGSTVVSWGSYSDGVVTITRSNGAYGATLFAGFIPRLIEGETYTLSATVRLSGTATGTGLRIGTNDTTPVYITLASKDTWIDASFTFTATAQVAADPRICINANNTGNIVEIKNIQLERGSAATTYAPYFTPIELCKIGDYQDYIYKSGEDWYVHKETQKDIFNGSENWADATATTGYTRCYVSSGGTVTVPDGYCDEFISRGSSSHGAYEYMWAQQTTNTVYIQVDNSRLGTASLANFKTWLGSHPAAVYRTLATATDTQITNATLISELEDLLSATTYSGTTYITVSGDLASPLKVVAEADSKLAPDSVYGAAIKDGAVSVDKIADLKALADALAPYLNS